MEAIAATLSDGAIDYGVTADVVGEAFIADTGEPYPGANSLQVRTLPFQVDLGGLPDALSNAELNQSNAEALGGRLSDQFTVIRYFKIIVDWDRLWSRGYGVCNRLQLYSRQPVLVNMVDTINQAALRLLALYGSPGVTSDIEHALRVGSLEFTHRLELDAVPAPPPGAPWGCKAVPVRTTEPFLIQDGELDQSWSSFGAAAEQKLWSQVFVTTESVAKLTGNFLPEAIVGFDEQGNRFTGWNDQVDDRGHPLGGTSHFLVSVNGRKTAYPPRPQLLAMLYVQWFLTDDQVQLLKDQKYWSDATFSKLDAFREKLRQSYQKYYDYKQAKLIADANAAFKSVHDEIQGDINKNLPLILDVALVGKFAFLFIQAGAVAASALVAPEISGALAGAVGGGAAGAAVGSAGAAAASGVISSVFTGAPMSFDFRTTIVDIATGEIRDLVDLGEAGSIALNAASQFAKTGNVDLRSTVVDIVGTQVENPLEDTAFEDLGALGLDQATLAAKGKETNVAGVLFDYGQSEAIDAGSDFLADNTPGFITDLQDSANSAANKVKGEVPMFGIDIGSSTIGLNLGAAEQAVTGAIESALPTLPPVPQIGSLFDGGPTAADLTTAVSAVQSVVTVAPTPAAAPSSSSPAGSGATPVTAPKSVASITTAQKTASGLMIAAALVAVVFLGGKG